MMIKETIKDAQGLYNWVYDNRCDIIHNCKDCEFWDKGRCLHLDYINKIEKISGNKIRLYIVERRLNDK